MEDAETKESPTEATTRTTRQAVGRPRLPLPGAVVAAAAALTALSMLASGCGGQRGSQVAQLGSSRTARSDTAPSADNKSFAAALAYSRCMRSHGVPDFPDPKQVGGEIQISGPRDGMNPQSPLFVSAQRSCRHLLPNGGQPTHAGQQQALARMLGTSRCMRAHGIPGFPDPTPAPPTNRAGHSAIMSNGVAWLAIPDSIDVQSPAFKTAAAACNLGLS